jgi:2-succinyl-5-enolpyruvyl-6-hydroxy-3-cyclohexene-1-carboxylate synthase
MPNRNHVAAKTLLGTLRAHGLTHVIVSPGSRNTPLAYAAGAVEGLMVHSILDERSAGFAGIGMAKATGSAVALICTSGTAAAEYLPAVVEANLSRVPLIVLTADRPPELRDVGAPQAIDQIGLYGSHVHWFHEVGVPEPTATWMDALVGTATRAMMEATTSPAGPVHLNVPFRDPLGPVPDETAPTPTGGPTWEHVVPRSVDRESVDRVVSLLADRPVVVCGDDSPEQAADLAEVLGWPLIADPLSPTGRERAIVHGDVLARLDLLDRLDPTAVLRFGAIPTSKALMEWMGRRTDLPQVVVDSGGWRDPLASGSIFLRTDPGSFAAQLEGQALRGAAGWRDRWVAVDEAISDAFSDLPWPSEPGAARTVVANRNGADLWVGSSMPIRDVDAFGGATGPRVYGHRGANGIDGLLSAAAGDAAATGQRVIALLGDLTLLHDVGAFVTAAGLGVDLTVVVVNNLGGGIFHFLPQADQPGPFDLLTAPHSHDLGAIVSGFGATYHLAQTEDELRIRMAKAKGISVIEVRTARDENVAVHRELWEKARAAVVGLV